MNCYYHPESEAVGICKNCGKALCKESSKEVESSLFCNNNDCVEKHEETSNSEYPRYVNVGMFGIPVDSKRIRAFDQKYRKYIIGLIIIFLAVIIYAVSAIAL